MRDRALFDFAIDSKLRGCDVVSVRIGDVVSGGRVRAALQDGSARFVAADMPEANELTIHIMAAVAQAEHKAISKRAVKAP